MLSRESASRTFLIFAAAVGLFAVGAQAAFDTLAGPLPKFISATSGPYLVVEDIEVPLGKTVTIEPGTVFMFKNFSGLHVQGRLVAEGTGDRPIVFTSEYDGEYNQAESMYPNPYDWNGIYIHENALGSSISHFHLFYSVYGIISDTKFFRIESGLFQNNGKSNLVIEGETKTVGDEPFSYSLTVKDATVDGVPVKILQDPLYPKRTVLRYSGLSTLLGGLALGVVYTLQLQDSRRELEALSSDKVEDLFRHEEKEWFAARDRRNKDLTLTAVGYSLFLLGSFGFYYSFTF